MTLVLLILHQKNNFFEHFPITPNIIYVPGQKKQRSRQSQHPTSRSHSVFPPSPPVLIPSYAASSRKPRCFAPAGIGAAPQLARARERGEQRGEGETCRRCNYRPLSCQLRAARGRATPAKERSGMKMGGAGVKGAAEGATPGAGGEIERKMSSIGREFRRRERSK